MGMATTTGQGRIRHYLAQEEGTLLGCLMQRAGLTREEGERLFYFGAVYQDRRRVSSDRPLTPGQYVRVHLEPRRFPVGKIDWRATVVRHNSEFVVVNKPAGIPVHATIDNQVENVLHQLQVALNSPLYITQRLDTEVSGALVFAKAREFQRQFNRLLVERKVKKRYRALVTAPPALGRHVHFMQPTPRSPKTVSVSIQPNWLECALTVVSVRPSEAQAFDVEIDLETGRTHQIRAQLSAMGSPILGDSLYGSPKPYEANSIALPGIALFSASTSWSFEGGQPWSFELPVPWFSGNEIASSLSV